MPIRRALILLICLVPAALRGDENTWLAPPARGQLELDQTLLPRGKGFLFVPAMTAPLNEPSYRVLQGKREVTAANPGTGVLLNPGQYTVLVGSGSASQMMSRAVEVVDGYTTLVKPFWSGLVINVIDETRTAVSESYELFEATSGDNYGIGFGIEEERGEAVRTWLLPAGTYEVVKVGDNASTTRKFSLRLLPGELVQRNLVVDSATEAFVGFYPPLDRQGPVTRGAASWKSSWQLGASVLFNTTQRSTGDDGSSLSLSAQLDNRSVYNGARHYAILRLIAEEGFAKEGGHPLAKSIDQLEARATYIYRLTQTFGPYLRGVVSTSAFPTTARFSSPQDLALVDADGDTLRVRSGIRRFTLSPSCSPLHLRQGIGINSQLVRSFPLNLNLRVGMGARQTWAADAYDLSADRTRARRLANASSTGLEALVIMDARLTRLAILDSEFDLLMPSAGSNSWEFNWENRLRLALSHFVSMDLVADLTREKPLRRLQARQQVLLRLYYLL
jgi:hypothetical protein